MVALSRCSCDTFNDLNGDDKHDGIVLTFNGNTHTMYILNGLNGNVIWERSFREYPYYNWKLFDVNGDGIKDILITSGSNVLILSGRDDRRYGQIVTIRMYLRNGIKM